MLEISTLNLSPDARSASETFDRHDLGELTADRILALLETFRGLDSLQNHEAAPGIIIAGKAGKFVVRTGQGKLLLYNARDLSAAYAELTAAEIVAHVNQGAPAAAAEEPNLPAIPPQHPRRGIAITMLVAGILLNGYTLYSAFYVDDVNRLPPMKLITEAGELGKLEAAIAGIFATGRGEGDRSIEIRAGGKVSFTEYGLGGEIRLSNSDTYRVGRRDGHVSLATKKSNVIDITSADTVTYFRDVYRRMQ